MKAPRIHTTKNISSASKSPRIEALEYRIAPASFVVTTLSDLVGVDGQVSLREAIMAANNNASVGDALAGDIDGDSITFSPVLSGTINLTSVLGIFDDLTIDGTGAAASRITLDAQSLDRIFLIDTSAGAGANLNVALADLVLTNGGIAGNGAGIAHFANSLSLNNVDITNSDATGAGASGGAVFNAGSLMVTGGIFSGNTAVRAGGAIEVTAASTSVLTGLTMSGNSTGAGPGNGGALHITGAGMVTINGGSVTGNTATSEGGGLWNSSTGILIVQSGTVISGNTAAGNVDPLGDNTLLQGGGGIFNDGNASSGGTLIIDGATIIGNSATGANRGSGGGVMSINGTVTMTNTTISGNEAIRAGGGIEVVLGTVSITNSTLSNNDVSTAGALPTANPGNGGALHTTGVANVTITGGTVSGNVAGLEGGGLWSSATGTMIVQGGTIISGNTANGGGTEDGGGGVFNNGGVVTISDATIQTNVATGGGIGNGGGGIFNDGMMTLTNTTVTGNTANTALANGGGILNSDGGTLIVNGGSITSNTTARAGGGIEANIGSVTLNNVDLSSNTAGINGGGLHISGVGSVTVSGGTVNNNIANQEGGGLWNSNSGTLIVQGGTIISVNSAAGDADITGNTALLQGGGGIFNDGNASIGGTLTINGATIIGNFATGSNRGSGGGILSINGGVTITNTTISGNEAIRAGGGIEVVLGAVSITNSALSNNDVSTAGTLLTANPGNGGALHSTGAANVTITGGTVSGNVAGLEGGGLWSSATGTMIVQGGTIISGNTANGGGTEDGGGGVFNNGGVVTISDATIQNNVATGGGIGNGGGGIFNDGMMTLTNTTVTGNTANTALANGGGILNSDGGTLIVNGGSITSNTTARAGGGIEANIGSVTLSNVDLSSNTAGINGGGLHISGVGSVTVSGGTVNSNIANQEGGGLWNSNSGTLIVQSGTIISGNSAAGDADITGNTALLQGGGGIFNDGNASIGGTLTINGATIFGNFATGTNRGSGGGILSINGGVTITNTTISFNEAIRAGGGIEVVLGTVSITISTITDNDLTLNGALVAANPGNGGGLHITGAASVSISGGTVSGNRAQNEGGGLWNSTTGTLSVTRATISSNSAPVGGGIFADGTGGALSVTDSTVSGNSASGAGGGGIASEGGSILIVNSTISGNGAASGGGLRVLTGTVDIYNSTVAGNNAEGLQQENGVVSIFSTIIADSGGTGIRVTAGTLNVSNSLIEYLLPGTINGTDSANIIGLDPLLGALASNGGPTQTHALLFGSPALNTGSNVLSLANDQRGVPFARVQDGNADIGAFEAPPPTVADIAANGRSATYTDVDGDLVKISVSSGTLSVNDFTLIPEGLGARLELINFSDDGGLFAGTNLSIKSKRTSLGGDGLVNVGYINATGIDLGKVRVDGDLGRIDAGDGDLLSPAAASLDVVSMGRFDLFTQQALGSANLSSTLTGGLASLNVRADLIGNTLNIISGDLAKGKVAGSLESVSLLIDGNLGSVGIGVSVTHSMISTAGGIGSIAASSTAGNYKYIGGLSVKGSVADSSIITDGDLSNLLIGGNLTASRVSVKGDGATSDALTGQTVGKVTVKGGVANSDILIGYDRTGAAVNADVQVSKLLVSTGWIASNLAVGATAGGDGFFGTGDDALIGGGSGAITAQIAAIIIKGHNIGIPSVNGDQFGFVAEEIGKFKTGNATIPLIAGAANDLTPLNLSVTFDVAVREVGGV